MKPIRLENWSVGYNGKDPWPRVGGDAYGHPLHPDGTYISSTGIKQVKGNLVTTRSGTKYELGEPKPEYVEYCKNNFMHVPTKERPLDVRDL